MATPSNMPHDAMFRAMLEDVDRADRLVRDSLPEEIAALLADTPVRQVPGSWIDEALAGHQADALFEGELTNGGTALVYLLLEHKSYPDPEVPVQLLRYLSRIWSTHIVGKGTTGGLPPIVPVVYYHGARRWSVPRSVPGMIVAPEPLAALSRSMEYILHDLARTEPGALPGDRTARAVLTALVLAFADHVPRETLVEILAALPEGGTLERQMIAYIVAQFNIDETDLAAAGQLARPGTWEALMGTIAETLITRGKAEGKAETLLRLLRRRFGDVPAPEEARIRAAALADLDAWLDAVLDAESLEAVLAVPRRN